MDHTRKLEIAIDSARKFAQMGSSQRVVNLLRKFHPADVVTILAGQRIQRRPLLIRQLYTAIIAQRTGKFNYETLESGAVAPAGGC